MPSLYRLQMFTFKDTDKESWRIQQKEGMEQQWGVAGVRPPPVDGLEVQDAVQ